MQNYRANRDESVKTQEKDFDQKSQQNYIANRDEFTKNQDQKTKTSVKLQR